MIYFPFFYFCFLLIFIWVSKKRFELSGLITGAYVVTSFFAIIIDAKQLYGAAGCVKATIDVEPTLLYCFLITLTIIPFFKLKPISVQNTNPIKNLKLFNNLIYFYFGVLVLFVLFFSGEVISRIQSPDIGELRNAIAAEGDDLGFSRYSGVLRIIARLTFIFGSTAMYLHVFYFYSIAFLKRSSKFNNLILLSSTTPILISMLSWDRSKFVYWIMSFIAVAIFFWPLLDVKRKKNIRIVFVFLVSLVVSYLAVITIARYGERDVGATNSLIVYAGQSFNNFCLFYDKLNITGISLQKAAPILNSIFGASEEVSRADLYSSTIDTNVFASFSGIMIREIQVAGAILYSFIYFLLAMIIFQSTKKYSITKIFWVVIFLYVPYLGVFGVYYGSLDKSLSVWGVLILCYYLKRRYTVV